ncbi:MAG: hypothetical protein ABSB88_00545 [Bryobacteraceae bacterium]
MRALLQIGLCCLLAAGAVAQRRSGGGGFHGGAVGGFHGGGGFVGGGFRGGGGFVGGGFAGSGFRGGFAGGFRGYYSPYLYGYPWYGSSYYYPGYYDYSPYISTYPYISNYAYPAYDYSYGSSPNVTVVYAQLPAAAPAPASVPTPVYANVATPSGHTYDQYGQEVKRPESSNAAPIYLVAMKDHTIYAAAAYWVDGKTLHYVTLQHQEKQAPLDQVDGAFSQQLNRERSVAFHLPAE